MGPGEVGTRYGPTPLRKGGALREGGHGGACTSLDEGVAACDRDSAQDQDTFLHWAT